MTSTPFITKHGAKGDKLDTVLVVLDDFGAARTLHSFDKYLSDADETAKPGRTKWSRNVFYVCCSRARQRLAIIDLTGAPATEDERMRTLLGLDRCYGIQQHGVDP